ncbi:hypothetical protein [Mycobacterium intracellulare]|uniref:hypothetical protein n=1 Tax=Mycobacterium intracellulare TaxID=1767 RepID=UPI0012FD8666|nr:hypothetical protein [Mycobacterium intracellulare]
MTTNDDIGTGPHRPSDAVRGDPAGVAALGAVGTVGSPDATAIYPHVVGVWSVEKGGTANGGRVDETIKFFTQKSWPAINFFFFRCV